MTFTNKLAEIIAHKKLEVAERKQLTPLQRLEAQLDIASPLRSFTDAITAKMDKNQPAFITEIKKGSPSKGIIRAEFDPADIAADYAKHGASCLSILTDEKFFFGHDDNLVTARQACELPVLRKEFIVDPYQVIESRCLGADCLLIIVAAVDDRSMRELTDLALQLNMSVFIESNNQEELERCLSLPFEKPIVAINNRDLKSFDTTLDKTLTLAPLIPQGRIITSASGIHTKADVKQLQDHGVHSFLVGESLMAHPHPGEKLASLLED